MKKILIVSDETQRSLINLIGSEALRIKSHCQNLFADFEVHIVAREAQLRRQIQKMIFLDEAEATEVSFGDYEALLLFQNSHFSSQTYRIAKTRPAKKIIVDLYNPLVLEKSSYVRGDQYRWREILTVVNTILTAGSFYLCANRRQFLYYLGFLSALGKAGETDEGTKKIAMVPTVLDNMKTKIASDKRRQDFLAFGGVYPWFDEEEISIFTKKVIAEGRNITFLGCGNPVVKGRYLDAMRRLRRTFVSFANMVHFVDWVNYEKIPQHMLHYKVAISLIRNTDEDYLAYRTRFLTLLQNGIPIITNGVDEISLQLIENDAGFRYARKRKLDTYLNNFSRMSRRARYLFKKLSQIDDFEKQKIKRFFNFPETRYEDRDKTFIKDLWFGMRKKFS